MFSPKPQTQNPTPHTLDLKPYTQIARPQPLNPNPNAGGSSLGGALLTLNFLNQLVAKGGGRGLFPSEWGL